MKKQNAFFATAAAAAVVLGTASPGMATPAPAPAAPGASHRFRQHYEKELAKGMHSTCVIQDRGLGMAARDFGRCAAHPGKPDVETRRGMWCNERRS